MEIPRNPHRKNTILTVWSICWIFFACCLSGCADEYRASDDTGSYTCTLTWPEDVPALETSSHTAKAIDCNAAGIATVAFAFYDGSGNYLTGDEWSCSLHQGTVHGINAGTNRRLVATGKNSSGNVLYQGEETGITIVAGQTTQGGEIAMELIVADTDWASVAAGSYHTMAIKTDGTLWAWGANWAGQLGNGTLVDTDTPVQIGYGNDWASVAAGYYHTVAIKTDGSLWAWGSNEEGQLGDGTNESKDGPTQIGPDTDWASVAAGYYHTVAVKTNGTLWAWGYNEEGQLGDGTNESKNTPTRIGADTDWVSVAAGEGHTVAVKTNGTLWAWGYNAEGQLGDGSAWCDDPINIP
jgi:hypothetical protein